MRVLTLRGTARSGLTLIESMVGVALFAVIGYALSIAVSVGNHSQRMVLNMVSEDRDLRAATTMLMKELRMARDASIATFALPDSNTRLTFQVPIDDAGAASWGVFDRTLGSTSSLQNRVNWSVRYTVRDVVNGSGAVNKQLVRQILDDLGAVQREKVLAQGLRTGAVAPAGFHVARQGDVWEVTLSTAGRSEGQAGIRTVFHVQTRN
jgi:type II secretory pathway component PulJ